MKIVSFCKYIIIGIYVQSSGINKNKYLIMVFFYLFFS